MKNTTVSADIEKELSLLSDQELLDEAKKLKSFSITNSFIVGFFFGIIIYSLLKNTWGLLTLIPLFFIHRLVNNPKNMRLRIVKKLIAERKLK